jgi:hypothetical protein
MDVSDGRAERVCSWIVRVVCLVSGFAVLGTPPPPTHRPCSHASGVCVSVAATTLQSTNSNWDSRRPPFTTLAAVSDWGLIEGLTND